MIKVAFTLIGGKSWTGGYNYLLNLVQVLSEHLSGQLQPILFFGEDVQDEDLHPFQQIPNTFIVRSPLMNQSRKRASLQKALLLGRDAGVRQLFDAHDIDVVFENAQFFGWRFGLPSIAWIPDFQHRRMRHLFSRGNLLKREMGFQAQVQGGRFVMLSSEDAERDCHHFYPSTRGRTRVVRFAVRPGPVQSLSHAQEIAAGHGLKSPFFFMPNQFWAHKNHLLVIEALRELKARGLDFTVAASGLQQDPRDPEHFPRVQARLQSTGLAANFRLLGLIPYAHLGALMRASDALINPSLFEGWSTTVEEAKSNGVPMILSDIPVHREQAGSTAAFFNPHDPKALADTLAGFSARTQCERAQAQDLAAADAAARLRSFATDFAAAVHASRERAAPSR